MRVRPGCRIRSKQIMKKYKVKLWNDFTCLKIRSEICPHNNSPKHLFPWNVSLFAKGLIFIFSRRNFQRNAYLFYSRRLLNVFIVQFISLCFLGCWRFANPQHARTGSENHVSFFAVLCGGTIRYFITWRSFEESGNVQLEDEINPLTPNGPYRGRTAPLTSKAAFYVFIQQT